MRRARSGALAVAASLFLFPALVYAHGALRKSEPANGAVLHAAPRVIRLTFNEPPQLAFTRVELVGPDSERVALSPLRVAASDSTAVVVADVAGPLRAGRYRILWQITSADGHPVRGAVAFSIAPDATGLAISAMDSAATPALPPVSGDTTAPRAGGTPSSATRDFDAGSWPYAVLRLLTYTGDHGRHRRDRVRDGRRPRNAPSRPRSRGDVRERRAKDGRAGRTRRDRSARAPARGAPGGAVLRRSWRRSPTPSSCSASRARRGARGSLLTGVSLAGLALALARRRAVAWRVAALGAIGLSLATALSGHAAASGRVDGRRGGERHRAHPGGRRLAGGVAARDRGRRAGDGWRFHR